MGGWIGAYDDCLGIATGGWMGGWCNARFKDCYLVKNNNKTLMILNLEIL